MNNKSADERENDPDSLTKEDREILKKKILTSTNIIRALNDRKVGERLTAGRQNPEAGLKMIFGILLILTGFILAFVTSNSLIGMIIGAAMVIAGIILPFSNFGAIRRSHTA